GLHLNTLPLRIRLRAQDVRDAVRETHRLLAELLRRQHARPLPVFSALFNYRHSSAETRSGPAAGIERLGFDERTHYPLALSVDDFGEAFALSAQAAAPLDPQQVCGLMHAALDEVVAGLERSPENPLAISGHGSEAPRRARATQKRRIKPRTEWERRLARAWLDLLGIDEPAADASSFDLGGHSLAVVRLIGEINRRHQVAIGAADVLRHPTLAQMARLCERQPKGRRQSAVIELKAGRAGPPVYFMYAGPDEFRLAQLLGERQGVYGIEVPWPLAWREAVAANRKRAFPTLREIAARYATVLAEHAGGKPCVLAGHSFGGLIAFEAAHELARRGGSVALVMLFDASVTSPSPYRVAWNQWRGGGAGPGRIAHWLWRHHKYRLWLALNRIKANSGLTSLLDEQGMPLPWKFLERLYLHIARSYRPRRLASHGVLFRTYAGDVDKAVHAFDDSLGWSGLFGAGLELVPIPGDHLSIMREHNSELARQMEEVLARHRPGENLTGGFHAHRPQSPVRTPLAGTIASLDAVQR